MKNKRKIYIHPKVIKVTTRFILDSLYNYYRDFNQWCCIEELRLGTGYGSVIENRIDMFVINCYPSRMNYRIAIEVKVSRSDFMNELKNPYKQYPAMLVSNQFYFAVPFGLVDKSEIPMETGLMEIDDSGIIKVTMKAPMRESYPPTWALLASIARREGVSKRRYQKLIKLEEDLQDVLVNLEKKGVDVKGAFDEVNDAKK